MGDDPFAMSPAEGDTFDDPRLKAAVRRAWGSDHAPDGLRERSAAMSASAGAGTGLAEASAPLRLVPSAPVDRRTLAPARRRWKERFSAPVARYALAAAAMVVVGFGLAYQLDRPGRQIRPGVNALASLPVSVTQGMVDRHEKCLTYADHHGFSDIPRGDFDGIGRRMHDELGFRVLSAPLPQTGPATGPATAATTGAGSDSAGPDQWEFAGAAVCPVDSYKCSHLIYRRKGRNVAVSVFSLPRHSCANIAGEWECEYHDPRHPMAGVIVDGGVYCVIGSSVDGSLTLAEVRQIFEDLRRRTNLTPRRDIPAR
jgi:hypothetical protein